MKRLLSTIVLAQLLCSATVLAQRTWLVDSRGGPHVDFIDLPQAVLGAQSGDTLHVVAGTPTHYSAATIDKPLAIIGINPGGMSLGGAITVNGRIKIRDIPAGSRVTVQSVTIPPPSGGSTVKPRGFEIENCDGEIHLENILIGGFYADRDKFLVRNCRSVFIKSSRLRSSDEPILIEDSLVSLSDSQCTGIFPSLFTPPMGVPVNGDTIELRRSELRVAASGIFGVDEIQPDMIFHPYSPPRHAVVMDSLSTLRIGTACVVLGGKLPTQSNPIGDPIPALANRGGTVFLHPRAVFSGGASSEAGTVISEEQSAIATGFVARGHPFEVFVYGPPNGYTVFAIGTALTYNAPASIPGIGALHLDPNAGIQVLGMGPLTLQGEWTLRQTFTMSQSVPVDVVFGLQALIIDAQGTPSTTPLLPFAVEW